MRGLHQKLRNRVSAQRAPFYYFQGRLFHPDQAMKNMGLRAPLTKTELKKRYIELAKQYHPDTGIQKDDVKRDFMPWLGEI